MARNTSTEETVAAPRTRKSPGEKAQSTLEQAQRRYDKAVDRRNKVAAEIDAAEAEVAKAERFLVFAQGDPDLPPATGEPEIPAVDASRA